MENEDISNKLDNSDSEESSNDGLGEKVKEMGQRALKAGGKSILKSGLMTGLGFGGIAGFSGLIFTMLYVMVPASKSYDINYMNNTEVRDTVSMVSSLRDIDGAIANENIYGDKRIVLSEENQAIENYHYYNSMKSLYSNKYYYPLEGVQIESTGSEDILKELLDKGVFIKDKEENKIIFNEKYIGKLKKVDEETDKLEIVDEYNREPYFQLPEELLAMLNTAVYGGKVTYDKPFLKGVDFKYSKTDEYDLGRPVYEFSTDYSSLESSKVNDFGLGSVFIYKPTFELELNGGEGEGDGVVKGLLYMGDSIFEGMDKVDVSKSNIVAKKGHTVKDGLDKSLSNVIKKKPEMVVMSYGTNDCVGEVDLEEFYKTYKELIDKLKKDLPNTKVYLTSLLMSESKYPEVTKYNEKIKEVAESTGATVIDSSGVFKGKEDDYFQNDKIHFKSKEGYALLREDIEKKVNVTVEGTGEVTEEVKLKDISEIEIKYLLDRVITFAGVYRFEYEVETEGEGGVAVKQKEKPINVVKESEDYSYIYKYLQNFSAEVPKRLYTKFQIRNLVEAFKGQKGSLTDSSGTGATGEVVQGGGDAAAVEQWRPMVEEISAQYGVNPNLILSLIWAESSGNPHSGNPAYTGLCAMGKKHSWLAEHFLPGDEQNIGGDYKKTGTSNDPRTPSCPAKGPHNEAEHQRAAKFQIYYACRRISGNMRSNAKKMFDKDGASLTEEEMFYVAAASIGAYNTGDGAQNSMRKTANYNYAMLYGPNGEKWSEYHWKSPGTINSKDNHTYIQKMYKNYPVLSGGIPFNKCGDLSLYDPSKWFVTNSGGNSKFDGLAELTTDSGTNGLNMNSEYVSQYVEYEEDLSKGKSTVVASVDENIIKLVMDQAVGMIEGKVYTETMNSRSAFWRSGYEKEYFAKGVASKAPPGYNMEAGIWKEKIAEVEYSGDLDEILGLAKMYGQGMFKPISKVISQIGKPYQKNSRGTLSYDMAGLIWYMFNYGEEAELFKAKGIDKYHEEFQNKVEDEEDIRPGDISFFAAPDGDKEKAVDAIIYVGNDAGVYVSKEIKEVELVQYSEFKKEIDKRIYIDTKRVLKFTKGIAGEFAENKASLTGMPAGFVEGDWAFPVLFKNKSDIKLTDGVGVRQVHPATKKKNIPHFGVDYSGPQGTPIIAAKAGKIIVSQSSVSSAGEMVKIDHGDGSTSAYYHLKSGSRTVEVGQQVEQGQKIGELGNTGVGTGPHLHFEIALGLPHHRHGESKDMMKFVPVQNMFKDLGIADTRSVPHNTIYPGEQAHWNNENG